MVSPTSIVAALLLHICGISSFIRHLSDQCQQSFSILSPMHKYVFGMSLLLILVRQEMLPKRCVKHYPCVHNCVELLCTVLISELALFIGWYSFQRLIHQLSYLFCSNCRWCGPLGCCMLTIIPSALLLSVFAPAHWREFVVQALWQLPRPETDEYLLTFVRELSDYVRGRAGVLQWKREDRPRAIRSFRMPTERTTERQDVQQI